MPRPHSHDEVPHGHGHDHDHEHEHTTGLIGRLRHLVSHSHDVHERVDDVMESSAQGIRAMKISIVGLGITALLQVWVVWLSGSTALLADTIHNFGDAATAIPLWIAFSLQRRGRSRRYTYGYGRAEDVAGVIIVGLIFFSACVAGYESIKKIIEPQAITHLQWVVAAAVIGFVGNEAVAVYRIRIGQRIGSAALIADGHHSRIDGLTSLAVLIGAVGVAVGMPILDPIVGLAITVTILKIVKDASVPVFRRLLDGIEPEILAAVEHAPMHVDGVDDVHEVRVRWLGHKVHADLHISVDPRLSVADSHDIVDRVIESIADHTPSFGVATVHVCPSLEPAA